MPVDLFRESWVGFVVVCEVVEASTHGGGPDLARIGRRGFFDGRVEVMDVTRGDGSRVDAAEESDERVGRPIEIVVRGPTPRRDTVFDRFPPDGFGRAFSFCSAS